MFCDVNAFPFVRALEAQWQEVHREYLAIRDSLVDWDERELYDAGWQVFGLFDFPHGRSMTANIARCPLSASLIERLIPEHGAAGFSVLRPNTRIRPHLGYQGNFLRCHLALDVPDGDCGLTVAGETRRWNTGRLLIFDDRVLHEAWNLTDRDRVVLLIDFVPQR